MDVVAQIILATGAAIAAVLFALKGPLETVLNRSAPPARSRQVTGPSNRKWTSKERVLFLSTCGTALALLGSLLEKFL